MPLGISSAATAAPSSGMAPSIIPSQGVQPGAVSPAQHSAVLQLSLLPNEILVHIAGYLRRNDALAFSRGSLAIFAALRRDVVDPLRLGVRIRWVNSPTAMHAAIQAVLSAPAQWRRALFHALAQRAEAMHPQFQEASHQLLAPYREAPAKPWWDALYEPADPARARVGMPDGHGELLNRVLAARPQARVRLLLSWFEARGTPPPPVSEWARIVSALPTNRRGEVLQVMARDMPDVENEYDQAQAIVLAAVRESAGPEGPVEADQADVLERLAWRLVWGCGRSDVARVAESWDAIFSLARRLPLQSQPKVLARLTEFVHREDAEVANVDRLHRRWPPFIDYVCSHIAGADVVTILGKLAEHNAEIEDDSMEEPVRKAILQAAATLPGEWRAALMAQVILQGPYDLPETVALWDDAFLTSTSVSDASAQAVYGGLAKAIEPLPDAFQDSRWHELVQRVETTVSPGALLPVLLAIANHGLASLAPERLAVLTRIGTRLPVQDRSHFAATMVRAMRRVTPLTWRLQITELADLPRHARLALARQLASLLFHYPANDVFAQASEEIAPDPGELLCARMPRTLAGALDTLSEILTLLPLADRGTVLLALSPMNGRDSQQPMPWSLPRVHWLLAEVLKLAPLQHHGIGVVANVLRVVALQCPSEADASALLPQLEAAVQALPADTHASPLFMLSSLMQRLLQNDKPAHDRWTASLAALPVGDREAAFANGTGSRKRKGAPE